jgi:hypothetical protein
MLSPSNDGASVSVNPAPGLDWHEYLESLQGLAAHVHGGEDALLMQDSVQQLAMTIAQAYGVLFSQHPHYPQLVSFTNPIINSGTNPDFMYLYSAIDPQGTYRLSGNRGSSLFIHAVQNAGIIGLDEVPGAPLGMLDVDTLKIGADGEFYVILSAERRGDEEWWQLDPAATSISIRQASYEWTLESDGRLAIECLDAHPPRPRPTTAETAAKLKTVARFAARYLKSLESLCKAVTAKPVNSLEVDDWSRFGGLSNQFYYQGRFELAPGEALILESGLPRRARYWGVVALDELFNALDWVNNQTSLNASQARLDSDGRFRAVLCLEDPGVPNWLDPIGRTRGFLQGRWFEASSGPLPTIRRVRLADLRQHLPRDTPSIDFDQRQTLLRIRRRGAQFRRKW